MGDGVDPLYSYHMEETKGHIKEIKNTLSDMSKALSALVRVEQQQLDHAASIARAHEGIEAHEARLQEVEKEIPLLRQTHKWVVAGVLGILALVGVNIYQTIVAPPARAPVTQEAR